MRNLIKRLPRKLKKQLRKKGINPKEFLEELKLFQYRDKQLDKIFDKNYEEAHKIIQKEIGEDYVS